jgi:hypothetical protein
MEILSQNPETEKEKIIKEIFKQPTIIGVEGGPCSGKSTFVDSLRGSAAETPIVILPEAATQIIEKYFNRGVDVVKLAKNNHDMLLKFESDVLGLTLDQIEQAKVEFYDTGAVIVADRVDIGGYLDPAEYSEVLKKFGIDQPPMLDLVDKILYFPTLAKKDKDEYMRQLFFNPCRTESPQEAIERCDLTLKAVSSHPEFHYMDLGVFKHTLSAATEYVKKPYSEIEIGGRLSCKSEEPISLLIEKHKAGLLLGKTKISQSYLEIGAQPFRIREEKVSDEFGFIRRTISIKDQKQDFEVQKSVSEDLYNSLEQLAHSSINKTRYRFYTKTS